MIIDGRAVVRAIKRIAKERGRVLYFEGGLYVLKTGLTIDDPEGIAFRSWDGTRWHDHFVSLETLERGMEATEQAVHEALT